MESADHVNIFEASNKIAHERVFSVCKKYGFGHLEIIQDKSNPNNLKIEIQPQKTDDDGNTIGPELEDITNIVDEVRENMSDLSIMKRYDVDKKVRPMEDGTAYSIIFRPKLKVVE